MLPPGAFVLALGLALAALAWWPYSRRRLIADTPTSTVRAMAVGQVELQGQAVPAPGRKEEPAPLTGQPCVAWSATAEEQRTRMVTEVRNGQTHTRTEHYWHTLASERSRAPFGLRDGTGTALVDPQGGKVPTPAVTRFTGRQAKALAAGRAFLERHGERAGALPLRFTETRLMAGQPLFVLGNAIAREVAGRTALVVQREGPGTYLARAGGEREALRASTIGLWILLALSAAATLAGAWMLGGG